MRFKTKKYYGVVDMQKVSNWTGKLDDIVSLKRREPFEWGINDCALFCADAIAATTGVDIASSFRKRYTTARGSVKVLANEGYKDLTDLANKKLGKAVSTDRLSRGDAVEYETENGTTLGICMGTVIATPGVNGLVFTSMKQATKGWVV